MKQAFTKHSSSTLPAFLSSWACRGIDFGSRHAPDLLDQVSSLQRRVASSIERQIGEFKK